MTQMGNLVYFMMVLNRYQLCMPYNTNGVMTRNLFFGKFFTGTGFTVCQGTNVYRWDSC